MLQEWITRKELWNYKLKAKETKDNPERDNLPK
jgi:hypothetical protein